MNDFPSWLFNKYLDWLKTQGEVKTKSDFAKWLGVSRPIVSLWMSGERKPTGKSIQKLSEKLGGEVYDMVGLPRPDPDLKLVANYWEELSPPIKKKIVELVKREMENNLRRGTIP
jgi:hypothetical protein